MQQNSPMPDLAILNSIEYLVGDREFIARAPATPALPLFDERAVNFLDALSKKLLADRSLRGYSDVISWAFWVRKASVAKEMARFAGRCKVGRGVAFHIAPSNVPVNFAVSLTSSLLAGNVSIVRVSQKDFPQVDVICTAMNDLLEKNEFSCLRPYVIIVRYAHSKEVNDYLSSICDLRVVWGGNRTVEELRASPLPPRAVEMCFPDRYSLSVIDADDYLRQDPKKVAERFYIDTYFTDQNACSSPRLIVWTGSAKAEAKERFFKALEDKVQGEYTLPAILAVDKLNAFCELSLKHPQVRKIAAGNALIRVSLPKLYDDIFDFKMSGGYFFEYDTDDLSDLVPLLKKTCQTVSYLGVEPEEICKMVVSHGVRGVDRIVPLGHTMDLGFFWDGYDMIETMSRHVDMIVWNEGQI